MLRPGDRACAVRARVQSCAPALLDEHLNCCVSEAIEGGEQARTKVNEASKAIARLVGMHDACVTVLRR
ncbi:metal-sensing transcriptional repressor [Streptomyces afghaniensis]|uniref:metal-sensing transcriptional repressor n=1 Tax=Streptomyces afghaniensis TaxID=66865 RepID=UPI0037A02B66